MPPYQPHNATVGQSVFTWGLRSPTAQKVQALLATTRPKLGPAHPLSQLIWLQHHEIPGTHRVWLTRVVPTQKPQTTLYHAPPSFYSQVARLVLVEKGVAFEPRVAVAGPPLFETYKPWYMHLNPGGTVPTLVCDDTVIADSREILHEVDRRFEGRALTPANPQQAEVMHSWIEHAYNLPERVLAYGSPRLRKLGAKVNAARRRVLTRQQRRNPDLAEAYAAKIADIDRFMAEASNASLAVSLQARLGQTLDRLDRHLSEHTFIAGDTYSLADVVWTVTVARAIMRGEQPLTSRTNLATWYQHVRARPSFATADIYEQLTPWKLVPIMAKKLRVHFVLLVATLSAIVVLAMRCG